MMAEKELIKLSEEKYLKHFPTPKWAVKQIVRYDRDALVEDICKHGVGHPNRKWLKKFGEDGDGIHGCCGCCSKKMKRMIESAVAIKGDNK